MRSPNASAFSRVFKAIGTLVLASIPLTGQTFDFENGIEDWTRTGSAFDRQPVRFDALLTNDIARLTIGGDYWRNLTYPMGQHGEYLIHTGKFKDPPGTGRLTSPCFVLRSSKPYFSFLIGGARDVEHERLELEVQGSQAESREIVEKIDQWSESLGVPKLPSILGQADDGYYVIFASTGLGSDSLRQVTVRLPNFALERPARVRIVDNAISEHISVDYIRFTSAMPDSYHAPVWGYADYHTHPMSYMAFGDLKGIHTLWGSPGAAFDDYQNDHSLVSQDIPHCIWRHGGGPLAEIFLRQSQKLTHFGPTLIDIFPHGKKGGPEFSDFPSFLAGAHQQMHITQIRRNYDGGLRLMVGLATENLGAEYIMSRVEDQHVRLVGEKVSLEAQIAGVIELAKRNDSWMQIAHTPEEARDIILHDKLAVILGVEIDQLGALGFPTAKDEVRYLWNMGVRAVTPVHAVDNKLGSPAVFLAPYNWLNDFLNRSPDHDFRHKDLPPQKFFQVETEDPCSPSTRGQCVQFHFDPEQQRLEIGRSAVSLFRLTPWLSNARVPEYETTNGQKNAFGLTDYGREYIEALLDSGMILDTAHMSDHSVQDVYRLIGRRLAVRRPDCENSILASQRNRLCSENAYPVIISHASFRAQAFYDEKNFTPSEYDISDGNLALVRQVGGVVGPFAAQTRINPVDTLSNPPFLNDCAMSSKSYGYAFHYGLQRMEGSGVGMATDFTFIPGVAPRFGRNACWSYHLSTNPKEELKFHYRRYDAHAQTNGIVYDKSCFQSTSGVRIGNNAPLTCYRMDRRSYDFNLDGLAHFGMVPDMLQDLKNVGLSRSDFEALFSSAEAYLEMWEKAERISTGASQHSEIRSLQRSR